MSNTTETTEGVKGTWRFYEIKGWYKDGAEYREIKAKYQAMGYRVTGTNCFNGKGGAWSAMSHGMVLTVDGQAVYVGGKLIEMK